VRRLRERGVTEDDDSATFPNDSAIEPPERTITTGTASRQTSAALEIGPGAVLAGRYQIEATLGQGGSGTVYRAWDRVLGEPIAIKILLPERARERSWIKRLAREVKVARAIRHPNVCRVFELGHADGHWFVTMELGAGGTLRDLVQDGRSARRPLAERLEDARAICAGLAAIHTVGIIHRDVTPQNVLRMPDGRLVLTDFGLAIEMTANTTVHGGTPNYMPPETLLGARGDQRADVWQLGVILHETLFGGRPVFEHEGDRVTMKSPLSAEATVVEEELARLCADCLGSNPALRPGTAMVVAGRLAAAETARPRSPLEYLWLRARRVVRRHRRLALAAVVLVLAAVGVREFQIAERPRLCRAAGEKLDGVWDGRRKSIVRLAFERSGRSYAADTFWSVNRLFEDYLTRWSGIYTEACEATNVRGEQSAEILDLRMACLRDRLNGVRSLSQLFSRADGDVVDNAVSAAGALGTLELCSDPKLLRNVLPPPEAPAARDEVARIRGGLADAKALHDSGNESRATASLLTLVADARRVRYAPVLAEALVLLGEVEELAGDNDAAHEAFREVVWQAEASRYDEVRAEAATMLVITSGRRGEYDEANDWTNDADAILNRIGGHDRLRAWLEMHVAINLRRQGRNEESLLHDRQAIAFKERSGASRGDIAGNLNNLALTLSDMGRYGEALGGLERAIKDLAQERGAEHPLVATFISNKGETLARMGRPAEARAAFQRALIIEERTYGAESTNLAYPLTGLGESYLADHQPGAALAPFERAQRIRAAHERDAALLAETDFGLARALWETNTGRDRALRLAAEARAAYARSPSLLAPGSAAQVAEQVAEIDRWLSTRTGS
jgi:eukaryotic-like serine/threonine-protein kinase